MYNDIAKRDEEVHGMDRASVGIELRRLRGDRTAREVAQAVGISTSTLLMYENGYRNPRDDIKVDLAKFYGVSIADIFYADNIAKRDD